MKQPFRPHVRLNRAQWTVLGILIATMLLEFIFSPYWHPWINDHLKTSDVGKDGKPKQAIYIDNQGFIVLGFVVFGTLVILMLTGVMPKAGYVVAGLLLLSVFMARASGVTKWLETTTAVLAGASGAGVGQE